MLMKRTHTHVLSCCKTEVSNIRSGSREWPGNGSSLVHWRVVTAFCADADFMCSRLTEV